MAKTKKPRKTPEQIEVELLIQRSKDLEAVNLPAEAAALPLQSTIEVTRAGQQRAKASDDKKVSYDTARRLDAFEALRGGMVAGAYDAARRFEADILARLGIGDRGHATERVDCDPEYARALRRAAAGQRVDHIQDRIPPRDFWLLSELIAPAIDRGTWRDHVAYITGESHSHAQGAVVRSACVNLRDAYVAIERRAAA